MRRTLPVIDDSAAPDGPRPDVGVRAGGATARGWAALDGAPAAGREPTARHLPHVVAWNLTKRCNLACAHCYIAAGSWQAAAGELTTAECHRIIDEIFETHRKGAGDGADAKAADPAPFFILSGGEPLLRDDLEEIAAYATERGATVVVGTNGTRLTRARIRSLKEAGVTGVAVSIDSLDPRYHDRFRHGAGALEDTLGAVERLREERLDFVVQTTITRGNREELPELVAWAAGKGAVSFNLYFLVATGRGEGMRGLSPEENDAVLAELVELERAYRGRMMVRSKCQPQIMRHVHQTDADSPLLNYGTRCPCGVHYCRITPEGKVTPCPYLPAVAGDLRERPFDEVWFGSRVFADLRAVTNGAQRSGAEVGGERAAEGTGVAAPGGDPSGPEATRKPKGSENRSEAEVAVGDAAERRLGGKCGRCEYRRVCGGCRARAFADGGDYLGADESCAYEPAGDRPVIEPAGRVTYGATADTTLAWSPDARKRMRRIPSFVRGVVTERVERFAREHGYDRVTPEVLDEVRRSLPVDFSKRKPFFLRSDDA